MLGFLTSTQSTRAAIALTLYPFNDKFVRNSADRFMMTQVLERYKKFHSLFQLLPDEAKQEFLNALVQNNHEGLETAFFYWECQSAREEDFLSDEKADEFLLNLPQ